ncbi:FHA domain-containing protein [uncultured Thiothrix sp.]|uniref:FHA domain-containing protein n=1 Tax=uncultured Thiothrix sp. TaxID=223185 RepID=UPI002629069A|nr:FHA domain-containing protein [uncultured Thiothrix sp.]
MADLKEFLLEIQLYPLSQYHRLTKFPVRIGRALDNDVILSDPTIAPYHLEIDQGELGLFFFRNLSKENGSRLNGKAFKEASLALTQPVSLRLGNRRLRLLTSNMQVTQTGASNCRGGSRVFCQPAYALGLAGITILAFVYEAYLQSIFTKELVYYLSSVMPYILGMIALALLIAGISRLANQRWEFFPALGLAALCMLVPHLLGELGHALSYLFTANWPLDGLLLLSNFLIIPLLFYSYIRIVHYTERWTAWGIALLFSAPLLVYQAMDLTDEWTVGHEFTGQAEFNRSLSAWDMRLKPTLSVDEYFAETEKELGS